MKKLIYTGKILAILSLVILQSCKKDSKVDFPKQSTSNGNYADFSYRTPSIPNLGDADGILVSVQSHNFHIVTVSPVEQESEYGMAKFTNTTGNFYSLADADSIWINSTNCVKSGDFSYLSPITNYSLNFSSGINWKVKGSGSVSGFTHSLTGANPSYNLWPHNTASSATWLDAWVPTYQKAITVITRKPTTGISPPNPPTPTHTDSVLWYGISHPQPNITDTIRWESDSATFKSALDLYKTTKVQHIADSTYNVTPFAIIPIKNYTANADSVAIIFNDGAGFNFERKVAATDSLCLLRPNDFALPLPQSYNLANLTLQINVIKYSSALLGGKKYYFLKIGSYIKYWKTI